MKELSESEYTETVIYPESSDGYKRVYCFFDKNYKICKRDDARYFHAFVYNESGDVVDDYRGIITKDVIE